MNSVLVIFLGTLVVLFFLAVTVSFVQTYRKIVLRRRNKRIKKFADENRGLIGENQNWQCWECKTIMLSNFHVVVDSEGIVALCSLCSAQFGEKYQHIYGDDDECKDFNV